MLSDFLKGECSEFCADGISVHEFLSDNVSVGRYCFEKKTAVLHKAELVFCYEGSFSLHCEKNKDFSVSAGDVILLSEDFKLEEVYIREKARLCCIGVDIEVCRPLLRIYNAINKNGISSREVKAFLDVYNGCFQIKGSSWSQSFLNILMSLSKNEQLPYCILKTAEFFHLLFTKHPMFNGNVKSAAVPAYAVECLNSVREYVETHLDEKMTITSLSQKFNMSPTALKKWFRELYGYPIHTWMLLCRVQMAAKLLRSTNMTILQISQSIGYESTSQFNVIFRRTYGVTPSFYRKNV